MKVTVKKLSELERELRFEVPKDRVLARMNEVHKNLGDAARTEPGQEVQQEMLRTLVPEVYQEGIEREDLFPIDMPEISDVSLDDAVLTFKATFEIKPDVQIKSYEGIPVKRKSHEVTEEEINRTLEHFKKVPGEDEVATIDEDFVHGLGYPTVDAFKESLVRQLEYDKDRFNRMDLERQLIRHLQKHSTLTTPQSIVRKSLQKRIHEETEKLKQQGVAEEEIRKKIDESKKGFAEAVESDIRVYLILDKIAQLEKIVVKEGENLPARVIQYLLRKASW